MNGAPLLFRCPTCEEEVLPRQVIFSETHTLVITAFCMTCQNPVCFDFTLRWMIEQMCSLFPRLPLNKGFTLKDISDLHSMGISFQEGGDPSI